MQLSLFLQPIAVFVLPTADGQLFAWGHNGYSQGGTASTRHTLTPTLVMGKLQGKRVVEVACGSHHSLALTHDGEVNCSYVPFRGSAASLRAIRQSRV